MGLSDDRVAVLTDAAQGIGHTIADLDTLPAAETAMQHAGEVSEVTGVALFPASDLSFYTTGAVLEVTGGRFM